MVDDNDPTPVSNVGRIDLPPDVIDYPDKYARLEETNKRNFELAQKNIKEVARLQAYLEQNATDVAAEIDKIRAADKTVEQRMRAEKAERALKAIASYPSYSMHDAFDNSNRMVQIALDALEPRMSINDK